MRPRSRPDAGAVLFAGPSGRGKSTTVAALAARGPADARRGRPGRGAGRTRSPRAWAGARGIRLKGPGEAAGTAAARLPRGADARRRPRPRRRARPVAAVVALAPRATSSRLTALSPGRGRRRAGGRASSTAAGRRGCGRRSGRSPGCVDGGARATCAQLPDDLGALADAAPRAGGARHATLSSPRPRMSADEGGRVGHRRGARRRRTRVSSSPARASTGARLVERLPQGGAGRVQAQEACRRRGRGSRSRRPPVLDDRALAAGDGGAEGPQRQASLRPLHCRRTRGRFSA